MSTRLGAQTSLLLAVCIAVVVQTPGATAQDAESGMALDLRTLSDTILPGQPVRLIARLHVEGENAVRGAVAFSAWAGRTRLSVTSEHRQIDLNLRDLVLAAVAFGDWVPPAQADVYEPGFEQVIDVLAVYDPRASRYLFEEPGYYTLRLSTAAFLGPDINSYRGVAVRSNAVGLTVAEPQGEERLAARIWRLPWGMPQQDGAEHAGFSSCPNTSYAKYAQFAVSGWAQISRAERIRILTNLAHNEPPRQIADLVLLRLAELLFAAQDYAGAVEWAVKVEELPDAPQHVKERAARLREQALRRLGQGAN